MSILEQELYPPIQKFFKEQGFAVFSEVKGCDVVARLSGRTVIVEMKTSFTLKLVYQAIDRQSLSEEVYVAIPRPLRGQNTKAWKNMLRLLKRLGIGLLTVAMDSPLKTVDVALVPGETAAYKNSKRRRALTGELEGRSIDGNIGGISRKKIVTAYRERAIELCCVIAILQEGRLSELRKLGFEDKQLAALRSNVYGWYCRKEKGVYILSEDGKKMLEQSDFLKLISYYDLKWREILRRSDE